MKTLVVYYSRTGNTKIIAEKISQKLNCPIEEIVDNKNREGAIGYLIAGKDASFKIFADINEPEFSPDNFDLVVIGTPIWAFTLAPAIRSYINLNKNKFKKVAFFCTSGGSGEGVAFKEMTKLIGKEPILTTHILAIDIKKDKFQIKLNEFISSLK